MIDFYQSHLKSKLSDSETIADEIRVVKVWKGMNFKRNLNMTNIVLAQFTRTRDKTLN